MSAILGEEELIQILTQILVYYVNMDIQTLFPKYVVVSLCQRAKEQAKCTMEFECWRFWDSVSYFSEYNLEVTVFTKFMNQIYSLDILQFYVRVNLYCISYSYGKRLCEVFSGTRAMSSIHFLK